MDFTVTKMIKAFSTHKSRSHIQWCL